MASVISSEPKDRSSLSVFRSLGGTLAGILIGMLAPMVVYYTDEAGNKVVSASRISMIAGIFSVLAVICYLLCYTLTTERVAYVPKPDVQKKTFGQTVSALFSSRSLMGLILSAVLLLLASLMSQGINQYLFADYFKNTAALSVYSLLMLPCVLVLSAVSTKLAVKYGKKECSLMIGMYFFQMQCWALVTDVIDDMEVKNHTRDDGTVYGMYSFARKIGQAIAGGLSGWALGWIGYDELATSQTQEVANGIYNLSTFFPAIIYALCGLALLLIYPLSKAKVEANVKELESRRK